MTKKKRDEAAGSKPFFARYLEGQDTEAASASIADRSGLAFKKAVKKPSGPIQTLKFPSDGDELQYHPYYPSKAAATEQLGGKVVTLKFPSDNDEDVYHAYYNSQAEAPKGKVKAKGGTVTLKKAPGKKK